MSTTSSQKPISSTLPTDEPVEPSASDAIENSELPENASEVSKRLNLLGKLIIPPAAW